jgi:signal transduction histidine kinase
MSEGGYLQKFVKSVQGRLVFWMALMGVLFGMTEWAVDTLTNLNTLLTSSILCLGWLIVSIIIGSWLAKRITKPTEYIAQAILHISPSEHLVPAPNLDELGFGRELADTLIRQVYGLTTAAQSPSPSSSGISAGLLDQLPVAVLGIDEKNVIALANNKARTTIATDKLQGRQLHDTLRFVSEDAVSIEEWLRTSGQNSLSDLKNWQKVEIKTVDDVSLGYFDVAVSFNKHSASGIETIIALSDHSDAYSEESDSISFMALAVHEMRTPLTIMRGYIEAFKDEIGSNTTPQIADDLRKMNVSAESLASFVSNILNVARINQGQLSLNLREDNWNTVLPGIIDGLRTRGAVYGKSIELRMQPNLPSVAIDRMTIGEVITNLIDNAIKYSPDNAPDIRVISKLNKDGQIETTVEDHGVGIPGSVMPNLFSKFQRNHRNRAQIGGTGLGLFLSKSIISAHNGNIWVSSKEGEGSTFGFTLIPFSQLAKDQQTNNNEDIIRGSHGWIKNHSMQRR